MTKRKNEKKFASVMASSPLLRNLGIFLAALIVLVSIGAGIFRLQGGQWFDVKTPSMGTSIPVGTLVLTKPTTVSDLNVGDVITFLPEGHKNLYYTHRVSSKTNDYVTTKGDNNPYDDPWRTTNSNIVGKVFLELFAVGWIIRMLPWLVIGWIIVFFASAKLTPRNRTSWRIIGFSFVFSIVALFIQPFVGLQTIRATPQDDHVSVNVVSTGIMPIKVSAEGNTTNNLYLNDGEKGIISGWELDHNGRIDLTAMVNLSLLGVLLVIVFCSIPFWYSIFVEKHYDKLNKRILEESSAT